MTPKSLIQNTLADALFKIRLGDGKALASGPVKGVYRCRFAAGSPHLARDPLKG